MLQIQLSHFNSLLTFTMKSIAALLCIVGFAAAGTLVAHRSDYINQVIAKHGAEISAGVIPDLPHPLNLNDSGIVLNGTSINGRVNWTSTTINHLDELVDDIRINLLTLDINITITLPRGSLAGNYLMDVHRTDSEGTDKRILGDGRVTGQLTQLSGWGVGRLQVQGGRVQIINLNFQLRFSTGEIWPENMTSNGEPVPWDEYNQDLPAWFDALIAAHKADIIAMAQYNLNELLAQYTLEQLICIILGGTPVECGVPENPKW